METKKDLAAMARKCFDEKLFAGTSGNLSCYDPDSGNMLITPTSLPYDTMVGNDIVCMKLDGNIVEGIHEPSSEWRLHAEIYKAMPSVTAVIHTHSPYAASFAVNHMEIPVILIEMVPFLGGDVKLADFAIPGTKEVGTEAVKKLKDRNACLMANHGVVAVGSDLAQAHIRAVYVEDAAKIYSIALNNGPVYTMSDEDIEKMKNG